MHHCGRSKRSKADQAAGTRTSVTPCLPVPAKEGGTGSRFFSSAEDGAKAAGPRVKHGATERLGWKTDIDQRLFPWEAPHMSLLLLFNQNVPQADQLVKAIHSADWTGIEPRLAANPERIAAIIAQIEQLDDLLAGANLTNAQRVQAGAAVDALKLLAHAPQPEWKAIAVILAGPTITALCNIKEIAEAVGTLIRLIVG